MKMISMFLQGGKAEGKNDGNLSFPYYTFFCKEQLNEQFYKCLCGIEDRICGHSPKYFDICSGIRLLFHK